MYYADTPALSGLECACGNNNLGCAACATPLAGMNATTVIPKTKAAATPTPASTGMFSDQTKKYIMYAALALGAYVVLKYFFFSGKSSSPVKAPASTPILPPATATTPLDKSVKTIITSVPI
jgi:hypothetical protein